MDNVRFGGSLSVPYYTQVPHRPVEEVQPDPPPPTIRPVVSPVVDTPVEEEPVIRIVPNALRELVDDGPDVATEESQETTEDLHDVADEHRPFSGKKKRR